MTHPGPYGGNSGRLWREAARASQPTTLCQQITSPNGLYACALFNCCNSPLILHTTKLRPFVPIAIERTKPFRILCHRLKELRGAVRETETIADGNKSSRDGNWSVVSINQKGHGPSSNSFRRRSRTISSTSVKSASSDM